MARQVLDDVQIIKFFSNMCLCLPVVYQCFLKKRSLWLLAWLLYGQYLRSLFTSLG